MSTESWFFISGALLGLLPLLLLLTIKKMKLLRVRPDRKIVYKVNGTQTLTLHSFVARNRSDNVPAPALLLFHGGRWLHGSPEQLYSQCQYFSAQGFTCFCAQYRLGSNGQPDVPGAIADAQSALRYLIDHAGELHIDAEKITVGGGSAGGHLAAALGAGLPLARNVASMVTTQRPAALVLYNPMLDLAPGTPDHHLVKEHWEAVSPYHHLDSAVPPSLILVGSQDPEVPLATVQAFCSALERLGGRCDIAVYEGQGHGFYHSPQYREKTNQRILQFLTNRKHEPSPTITNS